MQPKLADIHDYTRLPTLNVARAIALTRALLTAAPSQKTTLFQRAHSALAASLETLENAWQAASEAKQSSMDRRPADRALDNAWGALSERLAAWRRLSSDHGQVERAATLRALLFPDGLTFVRLPYDKQWAESERRLKLINDRDLAAEIDDLAGTIFLAELRKTHDTYGLALGITVPSKPETSTLVQDPLSAVRASIHAWIIRLIGTADDEDPEAVVSVNAALRPIDELRASLASSA